jgi:hypothetical protein
MTPLEITTSTDAQRERFDQRLVQLDVAKAHGVGARACALQHRRCHVDADDTPGGSGHLRGDQQVRAGAAAEVQNHRPGLDAAERPVIGDAGEALHGGVGHVRELWLGVAEVLRPGAPGGEDELLLLVGRDVGVGLADLLAQNVDVDGDLRVTHDG